MLTSNCQTFHSGSRLSFRWSFVIDFIVSLAANNADSPGDLCIYSLIRWTLDLPAPLLHLQQLSQVQQVHQQETREE